MPIGGDDSKFTQSPWLCHRNGIRFAAFRRDFAVEFVHISDVDVCKVGVVADLASGFDAGAIANHQANGITREKAPPVRLITEISLEPKNVHVEVGGDSEILYGENESGVNHLRIHGRSLAQMVSLGFSRISMDGANSRDGGSEGIHNELVNPIPLRKKTDLKLSLYLGVLAWGFSFCFDWVVLHVLHLSNPVSGALIVTVLSLLNAFGGCCVWRRLDGRQKGVIGMAILASVIGFAIVPSRSGAITVVSVVESVAGIAVCAYFAVPVQRLVIAVEREELKKIGSAE